MGRLLPLCVHMHMQLCVHVPAATGDILGSGGTRETESGSESRLPRSSGAQVAVKHLAPTVQGFELADGPLSSSASKLCKRVQRKYTSFGRDAAKNGVCRATGAKSVDFKFMVSLSFHRLERLSVFSS